MNLRAVAWLLGRLCVLLSALMLLPAAVSQAHGEADGVRAFLIGAGFAAATGIALVWRNRKASLTVEGRPDFFRREGLAAVGLAWLVSPLLASVPFVVSGAIPGGVDAFFEASSGFTTTGSSVLTADQIDALPQGIAFWRNFTQWLGGIGIVLMFVVLFPTGGRSLFRSEASGIRRDSDTHRVRDTALGVARIYVGLTVLLFGLLVLAGVGSFDALLHAFSTVSTGGFSNKGTSVAAFDSAVVEGLLIVFMMLAGTTFALYEVFVSRGWKIGWRRAAQSSELRAYLLLAAVATLVIAGRLWFWGGSNGAVGSSLPDYSSLGRCLRDGAFTVVSVFTTAGFATADFDAWPELNRAILCLLMVTGACAGSTSGGLKLVRGLIVVKAAVRGLLAFARPRAIHMVRMDHEPLDDSTVASVTGFFGLWVMCLLGGYAALSAMDVDPVVAFTGSLSALSNIGPGLGAIGPAGHWGDLPELGKLLLALMMILGRLEFYAVAVLVLPRFWRG